MMRMGIYLTRDQWEFVNASIEDELHTLRQNADFWGEKTKPHLRIQREIEILKIIHDTIEEELRNDAKVNPDGVHHNFELGDLPTSQS